MENGIKAITTYKDGTKRIYPCIFRNPKRTKHVRLESIMNINIYSNQAYIHLNNGMEFKIPLAEYDNL